MLKRTVSSTFFSTINNRRLFSLTTASHRQPQKNINEYSSEVNNRHRQFGKFHPRSPNFKSRMQQIHNVKADDDDLDEIKVRFNRYNNTRLRSAIPSKSSAIEDDDNDLFSEEKDDLTMLGADRKAFSTTSTSVVEKPSSTAISLANKTEK
jgi:hypothetical protein